jgi:hypothetical protein
MHPVKKTVLAGALVASTLAGGAVGAALINGSANAADTPSTTAPAANGNSSSSSSSAPSAPPAFDPTKGGHQANGITEQLLTGDTADKAKAAALAAVPGGTVQRVETDAEGAKYEAHMTKSDGTQVTVKMDADFKVTGVETGPSGPSGQAPGAPGNANGSGSTSTSSPNA